MKTMMSQIIKAVAVSGLALAAVPALAQGPAGAPGPVKVALKAAPEQGDWLKVCGEDPSVKKTICYTTRDFVAENNQPVMAVALYAVKDDTKRFVRILVPLTFLIPPGIRLSAEGVQPVSAKFQICLPQGCFVEGEMTDATINGLKKGKTLKIEMQNQIGQEVHFEVPLDGFAKAYDSAGIDQETLQKMQQQGAQSAPTPGGGAAPAAPAANSDEVKKRAEEMLKQRQSAPKQ
jgi:invasion protein IalB